MLLLCLQLHLISFQFGLFYEAIWTKVSFVTIALELKHSVEERTEATKIQQLSETYLTQEAHESYKFHSTLFQGYLGSK